MAGRFLTCVKRSGSLSPILFLEELFYEADYEIVCYSPFFISFDWM